MKTGDIVTLKKDKEQKMRISEVDGNKITACYFEMGRGLVFVSDSIENFEKTGGN